MFSDRFRAVKIVSLCFVLVGLCFYAHRARRELTLPLCLADPVQFDGAEVPLYVDARILQIEPGRLLVSQPGGPVTVVLPPESPPLEAYPGEYLEARTVFRREGYLELQQIRTAPLRKLKIAVSVVPIILVAGLLRRSLRWEKGRLVMKED